MRIFWVDTQIILNKCKPSNCEKLAGQVDSLNLIPHWTVRVLDYAVVQKLFQPIGCISGVGKETPIELAKRIELQSKVSRRARWQHILSSLASSATIAGFFIVLEDDELTTENIIWSSFYFPKSFQIISIVARPTIEV